MEKLDFKQIIIKTEDDIFTIIRDHFNGEVDTEKLPSKRFEIGNNDGDNIMSRIIEKITIDENLEPGKRIILHTDYKPMTYTFANLSYKFRMKLYNWIWKLYDEK